jgi:hypothetical protein
VGFERERDLRARRDPDHVRRKYTRQLKRVDALKFAVGTMTSLVFALSAANNVVMPWY